MICRALVVVQQPDGRWLKPGDKVDWPAYDWKLEPLDEAERREWLEGFADPERVAETLLVAAGGYQEPI